MLPPGIYRIDCPDVPDHFLRVMPGDTVQLAEHPKLSADDWIVEYVGGGGFGPAVIRNLTHNKVLDLRGGPLIPNAHDRFTDCIVWDQHGNHNENQMWMLTPIDAPMTFTIGCLAGDENFVTVQKCREDRANPIAMNVEPGLMGGNRWFKWRFTPI